MPGGGGSSAAELEGLGSDGQLAGLPGIMGGRVGSRYQMAGLGFGLPLSRLYGRYFGKGDVCVLKY